MRNWLNSRKNPEEPTQKENEPDDKIETGSISAKPLDVYNIPNSVAGKLVTIKAFATPYEVRNMDSIKTVEFMAGVYDYASVFAQAAVWLHNNQDAVLIGVSHSDIEDVTSLYLHYDNA